MKRNIFFTLLIIAITSATLFNSGCISKALAESVGRDIRENSNFEIGFLQEIESEFSFEDYYVSPGFGVTGYVPKKYGEDYAENEQPAYVMYSVSSWRSLKNSPRVTSINCYDSAYNIYGLSIGDSYTKWEEVLSKKGFKLSEGSNPQEGIGVQRFYKKGVRINVNLKDGVVFAFSLYAENTNLVIY